MFPIHQFINFSAEEEERIRVFDWSKEHHKFVEMRGEQASGYRQGVKKYHFDSHLGVYPQENISFWSQNTKYITKEVLKKLNPV